MLTVDDVRLAVLPGPQGGKVTLTIRGRDIVRTVKCALLNPKKSHESLTPTGWKPGLEWQAPVDTEGGDSNLRVELDTALGTYLQRNKAYPVKLSFQAMGETFVRDATATWQDGAGQGSRSASFRPLRFLGRVAALLVLVAVLVGAGAVYLGPPYDLGARARWDSGLAWLFGKTSPPVRGSDGDLRAAADHGDGNAAFLLASYYDPAQTDTRPDISKRADLAYRWYQRAAELDHREAEDRLRTLRMWVQRQVDEGNAELAPLLRILLQK